MKSGSWPGHPHAPEPPNPPITLKSKEAKAGRPREPTAAPRPPLRSPRARGDTARLWGPAPTGGSQRLLLRPSFIAGASGRLVLPDAQEHRGICIQGPPRPSTDSCVLPVGSRKSRPTCARLGSLQWRSLAAWGWRMNHPTLHLPCGLQSTFLFRPKAHWIRAQPDDLTLP